MAPVFVQFSDGISHILLFLLAISSFPDTTTAVAKASMEIVNYDEFQIMEGKDLLQSRHEKILHRPLTSVKAVLLSANPLAVRKKEQEDQRVRLAETHVESRRKLREFIEMGKTNGSIRNAVTFPTSLLLSPISPTYVSLTKIEQDIDADTLVRESTTTTQYSMAGPGKRSRSKRTTTNDVVCNPGSSRTNKEGKGKVPEHNLKKQPLEKDKQSKSVFHQDHHDDHEKPLRKRYVTVPPPYLFMKIFMDYSSTNNEERRWKSKGTHKFRNIATVNSEKSLRIPARNNHELDDVVLKNTNTLQDEQQKQRPKRTHKEYRANFSLLASTNDSNNITVGYNEGSSLSHRKCIPTSSSCPDGFFACKSNSELCVPQSEICNGKKNCPDGSDEDKDCINIHEKNFWDSYFKKRPAADVEEEGASGNGTCLYIRKTAGDDAAAQRWSKLENDWKRVEHQEQLQQFQEMIANEMCVCSREKVFCHNVHLPNLLAFPDGIQFL